MSSGTLAVRGASGLRSWALYAVATVALIALIGWLLALALPGPRDATAIRLSAIVAIVVQLAAFAVTKALARQNLIAGWGAGSLLRFMTLVVYGLIAVKGLGLAPLAALVSLAAFFFVSTVIEPLFLRQ